MGRDLFWRKIVVCALVFLVTGTAVFAFPEWLAGKKKATGDPDPARLTVRQGHMGPAVFGFDFPFNETVLAEIKRYELPHNREILETLLEKGNVYRDFILSRLKARKLPEELFFVVFIESQFEPRAVSGAGAAGLWQLMDFTAAGRGLVIDDWRDERRDFWRATDTALDILASNYDCYGDWLLALAAYNAGRGAVDRAIEKSGTRDFFRLAVEGFLPAETAAFVPKILAAAVVGTYRGRNRLPYSWEPQVDWRRIRVTKPVDLRSLSGLSAVPFEVLRRANAELSFPLTPPPGTEYYLKVPARDAAAVERALSLPEERLAAGSIHSVRQGDTFYGLARYYRIPLAALARYNPRFTPETLPVGAKLVIPRQRESLPPPPRAVLFTGQEFSASYTIRKGDTLFNIAGRFGVPVEELAANNLRTLESVIHPGETLNVPAAHAEK